MIALDVLADYDASRPPGTDRSVLCHAPFVSLNFDQSGRVTACCYNRSFVLGTYPRQSVREIWTGAEARALREAFVSGTEARGCDLCFHQLRNRNFAGVLMRQFDPYGPNDSGTPPVTRGLPKLLEFEISNTCSLECVMCAGHWSSTIRARREKLPPLRSPYDREFARQIEEFLPTIAAAKFLGGEPFLIERYYDIWDSIRRLNPEAQLCITTSAAVVPERARSLLEHLRASIVVSLDSLTPATYESIRKNARFEDVMRNVEFFRDYARRRGTDVSIAVCPMVQNWRELRSLVAFCEQRQMGIHFNTLTRPAELSLGGLTELELAAVIDTLEEGGPSAIASWTSSNRAQWQGMISQLRGWLDEKRAFSRRCSNLTREARLFAARHLAADPHETRPLGRVDDVIEPLILAYQFERERAGAGEYETMLLPRPPLPLWPVNDQPEAAELLAAAHLVGRFAESLDDQSTAADRATVEDEHRRLRRFVQRMLDASAAGVLRLDRLGAKLRAGLVSGEVRALRETVRLVLEFADDESPLLPAASHRMRTRLNEAWDQLPTTSLDAAARRRIAGYVNHLIASRFPAFLTEFASLDTTVAGALGAGRICSFGDLLESLHAVHLFYRYSRPSADADHDSFLGRVERLRRTLTERGPTEGLLSALSDLDVNRIYSFLADASEEELARALARLA